MTVFGTNIPLETLFRHKIADKLIQFVSVAYRIFFLKIERFSNSGFGYLPRWVILSIDMVIVVMTGLFTLILLDSAMANYVNATLIPAAVAAYLAAHLLVFRVFQIYSGIVRHSSMIDVLKIILAQFTAFVILLVVNYAVAFKTNQNLFLTSGLLINILFTGVGLFSYRIIIKHIFINYIGQKRNAGLTNAVIVGTNSNAISMANALNAENPRKFRIVGFMDKSDSSVSKRILNQPVFNLHHNFEDLSLSRNAQALIISDESMRQKDKEDILERALTAGLDVFKVAMVANWNNPKDVTSNIKKYKIEDLLERSPIKMDNSSLSGDLSGKTIMVTGAAGSIGSEIVRQVLRFHPAKLIMVDQAETPMNSLSLEVDELKQDTDVVSIIADIRDKELMRAVFENYSPEMVYHAAAYKHVPMMEHNPAQAIFTNVMGTKNLADLSVEFGVRKFVMVSTDKAVNPSNVMGASKRIAEKYVQSLQANPFHNLTSGTKFITTRFGNVLGSNGSVVPLFTKQIEMGGPITITHPDIIRYFMTIPEACQLVLEAGTMGKGGEIFIFDMGEPVKIIDLARKMIKLAGLTPDKDIKIEITGLRPGEKLYEELLNDTSVTLPTYHEKITIFQDTVEFYSELNRNIHELIGLANTYNNFEIVRKMKAIIPEFKSMNSKFEKIDQTPMLKAS